MHLLMIFLSLEEAALPRAKPKSIYESQTAVRNPMSDENRES
jgi:hypothetical protein